MSARGLPIIDIGGLRSPVLADRQAVATQLRAACEGPGFFYITHHGISAGLRAEAFAELKRYFDLPVAEKMKLEKSQSPCNRGYQAMGGQTLQFGKPPDVKEGFYIGVDLPPSDPRVIARKFNHGANVWPEGLTGFRPVMEGYFAQMMELAAIMIRGFALSLCLGENDLDGFMESGGMGTLFMLHYPPQPANPKPGERGCGEHTDFGGLTLLAQGEVGGLQILDAETGEWIDAPPIPDTFVVNIGDLLSRWTNGKYHSTLHRVVNLSGKERYSLPFFFTGHPDYLVRCLPQCLEEGESPKFPPVTVSQHLTECFTRMQQHLETA